MVEIFLDLRLFGLCGKRNGIVHRDPRHGEPATPVIWKHLHNTKTTSDSKKRLFARKAQYITRKTDQQKTNTWELLGRLGALTLEQGQSTALVPRADNVTNLESRSTLLNHLSVSTRQLSVLHFHQGSLASHQPHPVLKATCNEILHLLQARCLSKIERNIRSTRLIRRFVTSLMSSKPSVASGDISLGPSFASRSDH